MDEVVKRALHDKGGGAEGGYFQSRNDAKMHSTPMSISRRSSVNNKAMDRPSNKSRSLTSAFTSGPVGEEAPSRQGSGSSAQPKEETQSQLRGPFISTPSRRLSNSNNNGRPFEDSNEIDGEINTTFPNRPDPARRNTSTAYFFQRLAGVETAKRPAPLVEVDSAADVNAEETLQPLSHQRTPERQETGKRANSGQQNGTATPSNGNTVTQNQGKGWAALRARIRHNDANEARKNVNDISRSLSGHELVSELGLGLLPVMMIKMSLMDRDEHGGHRIPVLLNYLKLRITDSVYPFHNNHALFRIELEYGDGLLKWVVYRELRDFVNLHAHYRISGLTSNSARPEAEFPSFPKTSLPYFSVLKREKGGAEVARSEFARSQRNALENYLLKVIRSVMFRPEANRLAKFLEISALSIELCHQGGSTGKQGFLRLLSTGVSRKTPSGLHPLTFKKSHDSKWFIVRESYVVIADGPESREIFDVFLFDVDFNLERPKRLYRKGINAVKDRFDGNDEKTAAKQEGELAPEEETPGKIGRGGDPNDPSTTDMQKSDPEHFVNASQHTFYVNNGDRRLKIVAKNERLMDQFVASIERMAAKSIWIGKNRFDSFAPIRMNVSCQWLIDGVCFCAGLKEQRDYLWNLSRAVAMAKRVIYIHDWWLSPELYLRRPPIANPEWRLDRLLKKKAQEGVKIYVIIYKEVGQSFTPVDSLYSKNRLHDLHPNISVQRSPDSEARNLLWSHHEKICVIDETIAFMGGIDLCFGRWDTPGHTLVDDRPKNYQDIEAAYKAGTKIPESDFDQYQIWPGKDYSNQRAGDFHTLNKPEEDMYDRHTVPRQPWHDVGLQIVGQPARDLCRHFVQRWNWLLRIKHHSRLMPFLLPPADYTAADLEKSKIVGTCEAQICRSAGPWSIGTPKRIEHSIQNAYCKAIQLSEAFVYIENQYFSTSTIAENVKIENQIGDAIVSRIMRAHSEGMPWRACIIIPLTPGYPMPMDSPDAAAVRMIMEAQARSMYRGENSIFARLRREGIDPSEHINFFSLRAWGKMKSGQLTTQDVYIHNKIMIVDDRLAVIGSANINERSQRGDRDSEVACVIRDTDMIDSTMAGIPFKVGRFAHTMRIRLMREHIGIDVDQLAADGQDKLLSEKAKPAESIQSQSVWDPENEQESGDTVVGQSDPKDRYATSAGTLASGIAEMASGARESLKFAIGAGGKNYGNAFQHSQKTLNADGMPDENDPQALKDGLLAGPSLEEQAAERSRGEKPSSQALDPEEAVDDRLGGRDPAHHTEDELRHLVGQKASSSVVPEPSSPKTALKDKMTEKIRTHKASLSQSNADDARSEMSDTSDFGRERTHSTFSKAGDSLHPFTSKHRHTQSQSQSQSQPRNPYTLPTAAPDIDVYGFSDPLDPHFYLNVWTQVAARNTEIFRKVFRCTPDDRCLTWTQFKEWDLWEKRHRKPARDRPTTPRERTPSSSPSLDRDSDRPKSPSKVQQPIDATKSPNKRLIDEGFTMNELEQMEKMLGELRGNLVVYPVKFLESEAVAGNNLFSRDRIQPMAVYD